MPKLKSEIKDKYQIFDNIQYLENNPDNPHLVFEDMNEDLNFEQ